MDKIKDIETFLRVRPSGSIMFLNTILTIAIIFSILVFTLIPFSEQKHVRGEIISNFNEREETVIKFLVDSSSLVSELYLGKSVSFNDVNSRIKERQGKITSIADNIITITCQHCLDSKSAISKCYYDIKILNIRTSIFSKLANKYSQLSN